MNDLPLAVEDKPLVTLVLFAYNQANYIREAVGSALAQSYLPLEIILSDDCSIDDTYNIMEGMVRDYDGGHKVLLNRNEKNLGIAEHVSRVIEMAAGNFIVFAAGDDISTIDRVSILYEVWINSKNKVSSVFSNLEKIDKHGNLLGPMFRTPPVFAKKISDFKAGIDCWVVGASFSFEKKVYSNYGQIHPAVRQEDGCLAFRALLEGEIAYIDKLLVKYRHHGENVSQSNDPARRLVLQRSEYFMKKSWLNDAEQSAHRDPELINLLRWKCKKAYVCKLILTLPFVGYVYNFMRIKAKSVLSLLK